MPPRSQPLDGRRKLSSALLKWYRRHRRDLPWRKTREPYRIWVSEIMLQQTRVAAVLPYYDRFLKRFPDVGTLASADEQVLLESWSGLGYYRRVRQMQAAARLIVTEHGGVFPKTYDHLFCLPGIGPYTAAAIASISFGRAHAVVDGNVIRVLTRLFDESGEVTRSPVRSRLQHLAQQLIESAPARSRGAFNQALMELGATVCTPRNPKCLLCPVALLCKARRRGVEHERPVKARKERTERLEMAVAIVRRGSKMLLRQRPLDASLMPGFWELPQLTGMKLDKDCFQELGIECSEKLGEFRHGITFREYRGTVYLGHPPAPPRRVDGHHWVPTERLETLPLTTITRKALAIAETATTPRKRVIPAAKLFLKG